MEKFRQLASTGDGKVTVEAFVSGLKEKLGAAWNDNLVEPARAFHAAASRNLATTKDNLDKAWSEKVVANFRARVVQPAEAFYQAALQTWASLSAGNAQVTLAEFTAGMRVKLGKLWTDKLHAPTQYVYNIFSKQSEQQRQESGAPAAATQ